MEVGGGVDSCVWSLRSVPVIIILGKLQAVTRIVRAEGKAQAIPFLAFVENDIWLGKVQVIPYSTFIGNDKVMMQGSKLGSLLHKLESHQWPQSMLTSGCVRPHVQESSTLRGCALGPILKGTVCP
ncbi:hypothetical protein RIF29_38644 [Crotalaria pallida]|uniref:Uncharacterized protein n=1 Tax=Crotalaria pallida TaxID=3830 RepID=A0AAN9E5X6_CROPI